MGEGRPREEKPREQDVVRRAEAPMRSLVNWGLLGLVVERPSYAYDLAQRFERRYRGALSLSNIGHVYTALGALAERGYVREIPGTREGRQPRPRYRATDAGIATFQAWLVDQANEERRRRLLFVLALAALGREPEQLRATIERCEQAWLTQGMDTRIRAHEPPDELSPLFASLIEEEERLAVGAKLAWAQYARERLSEPRGRA